MKVLSFMLLSLLMAWPAAAKDEGVAYVLVDASDGRVLMAEKAGEPRQPASLTKLMTIYLAFVAVDEGKARADTKMKISAQAAGQAGTTLGLHAGRELTLAEAVKALIVRSANDAAMVIAEHLAGGDAAFVERMNAAAFELGMTSTRFQNPSGLTQAGGDTTTARDMGLLAMALQRRFPDLYPLFGLHNLDWGRQNLPSVNGFLTSFSGAEGMKTGFTCPAGYNLAASASRNGRRAIAVILGAPARQDRDALAIRLMEAFFKDQGEGPARRLVELANKGGKPPDFSGSACVGGGRNRGLPSGWALEVAYSFSEGEARRRTGQAHQRLAGQLEGGVQAMVMDGQGGRLIYRGLIAGLKEDRAVKTCLAMRGRNESCLVLSPAMVEGALDTERRLKIALSGGSEGSRKRDPK